MPSAKPLRVASVNVNGVRAAFRRGMGEWLEGRGIDLLAMQEVRASTEDLQELLGDEWDILHDPATAKGRAGVAIASRNRAEHPPRGARRTRLRQRGALARGRLRGRRPRGHRGERLRALGRGRHPEAGREVPVPRRDGGAAARARPRTPSSRSSSATSTSGTARSTSATGRAT